MNHDIFRMTERFSFLPKDLVRHVVVDGGDHKMKGKTDWWDFHSKTFSSKRFQVVLKWIISKSRWFEREQTRVGVQSVKSWVTEGNFGGDDIFISGDADEVSMQNLLFLLYLISVSVSQISEVDIDRWLVFYIQVISRSALHSLLNCRLVSSPVTGALWFPLGDPNLAFKWRSSNTPW